MNRKGRIIGFLGKMDCSDGLDFIGKLRFNYKVIPHWDYRLEIGSICVEPRSKKEMSKLSMLLLEERES